MSSGRYATPAAFKQALEQRLKTDSGPGAGLQRRRQLVVFDRFLARVAQTVGESAILKGGLVLELRLAHARTTKGVDLRMAGSPDLVLVQLQEAGRLDLGDWMRFDVQADPRHPELRGDGMRYEGYRFRAECRLAGKVYGRPFGVDVAFGDPLVGEPDSWVGDALLEFAGIAPAELRLYPVATHLAEKLHAYTMPRKRPNSRIKDLPDLALLATAGKLSAATVAEGIGRTFEFRNTHPVPKALPEPPGFWSAPYEAMARLDGLEWQTLKDVHAAAARLLDPVLDGSAAGQWSADSWTWSKGGEERS